MDKHIVFISHIKEESNLATIIKSHIQKDFLGLIKVFVSSDNESLSAGSKWLNSIEDNLKMAKVELLLCSKNSIKRPWINFEAGAGWIRDIPVIPICHTDIKPVNLPIPLNMLQAIEAGSIEGLKKLYHVLAGTINAATSPEPFFDKIVDEVKKFELEYGLISNVAVSINALYNESPSFLEIFQPNSQEKQLSGRIPEILFEKIKPHLENLKSKNLIDFSVGNNCIVFGPGGGNRLEINILVKEDYSHIANQVMKYSEFAKK
jgi:TIR domain